VVSTGANRRDRKELAALLDAQVVEPTPATPSHPVLDRGDDSPSGRDEAMAHGSAPPLPPKASEATPPPPPGPPDRHQPRRWVVEVTHSWVTRCRRPLTRWDEQATPSLGFIQPAACLIISRKVRQARSLPG